ncbi:MAG TPA: hypothetical protein PKW80_02045 [Bacteroidales bacterium]|nr:hypothetical protein [Bacteroidales bacterium]
MWIIADKRLPSEAKHQLGLFGNLLEFESSGIVYEAISDHPDVFMCDTGAGLIVAPNMPSDYIDLFTMNNINYKTGNIPLGKRYPDTAMYNAVITGKYLIHNLKYTDKTILEECNNKIHLHTNQAYTRCNLMALNENDFITSDRDIEKILKAQELNVLYVDPDGILLPGFRNGFFGGCCGLYRGILCITGNIQHMAAGSSIQRFIENSSLESFPLCDGELFDGGGIFFINT